MTRLRRFSVIPLLLTNLANRRRALHGVQDTALMSHSCLVGAEALAPRATAAINNTAAIVLTANPVPATINKILTTLCRGEALEPMFCSPTADAGIKIPLEFEFEVE
jgi:hypothetical protein